MLTFLYAVCYLFVFTVGLCIGSFLNVLVYRIPNKLDFVRGRSFCPACKHSLAARDLVPVFSWLFLRAKCRYCGAKISARYPLVELAGGALAVLSAARFGFCWQALLAFAVLCVLLTVALIDADTQEIPNGLVIALGVLAVAAILAFPGVSILDRVLGAFCVSLPMALLNFAIPTSFGGGDCKLMAAAGLLLGWKMTLVATFFAILTGGAYGVYLLATRKKGGKEHFAFGPFLTFGIALALFAGEAILGWYLGLF